MQNSPKLGHLGWRGSPEIANQPPSFEIAEFKIVNLIVCLENLELKLTN